ncbi:MAG TPA: hypothetical protein VGV16_09915 [Gammaproteobacteria bacterium]|nr:hypothetical protein [Gammaproteobacteria bacterium]
MHPYGRAARLGRHALRLSASVAVLWMVAGVAAPAPADVSREMDAYLTARTRLGGFTRTGGMLTYEHDGDLPGYVSSFIKLPGSGSTLIVLCNLDRARLDSISTALLAIADGRPYDMPVQGKPLRLNEAQLTSLVGEYRSADGAVLTMGRDGRLLSASLPDRYQGDLIPLSPSVFYFPLTDGPCLLHPRERRRRQQRGPALRRPGPHRHAHRRQPVKKASPLRGSLESALRGSDRSTCRPRR